VRQNLAFGLRVRRVAGAEIDRRVSAAAESLGIEALLDRLPAQLSGGQRQRVALGRAIVRDPQAFLLDEPLSNLDPRLRGETRAELVALHGRLQATMVYVTHDQEEAMTLGQRIAVLNEGSLEQLATPDELYRRPVNTFVAGFIGSPPMNLIDRSLLPLDAPAGAHVIGSRPHDVKLGDRDAGHLRGGIEVVEPLGHAQIVHIRAGPVRIIAAAAAEPPLRQGDAIGVSFDADRLHCFGARGRRLNTETSS
jgi:multiple sugar transport system ATP-binding protein